MHTNLNIYEVLVGQSLGKYHLKSTYGLIFNVKRKIRTDFN